MQGCLMGICLTESIGFAISLLFLRVPLKAYVDGAALSILPHQFWLEMRNSVQLVSELSAFEEHRLLLFCWHACSAFPKYGDGGSIEGTGRCAGVGKAGGRRGLEDAARVEVPVHSRSRDDGAWGFLQRRRVCAPRDGAAGCGPLCRCSARGPVMQGLCSAPCTRQPTAQRSTGACRGRAVAQC